ncbi:MAG: GNAT family N-acetyltransferase [Fibrobacter sp.]|nr:GNAT family N-acetyltransferase [Fibrobacter sp.]
MDKNVANEKGRKMRIYLRPITLDDGTTIVKWRNSLNVSDHCFDKTPITVESNALFYRMFIETGKYKQFIVERVEEDSGAASYPIATVYLKDFDKVNNRCEFCIFTSNDQEWNTESQSIAVEMLLKKAFDEYGMHKVYTFVFADNKDEIALMKRAGFAEEAVLVKEAKNRDGQYVDILRMSIFADK